MPLTIDLSHLLDRALRAQNIPIEGVSVGRRDDRATWTVQYQPTATADQRLQGQQILATLDPQDAATATAIKGDLAGARLNDDLLRAIIQGLHEAIPAPSLTLPQLRARILAIYRGLL
jgi:hypothetical protein